MATCGLTQGFPLDCRDAVGGIKSVRFATLAQWTSLGASVASGEVQSFSAASTVFYKYEQLKESSNFVDNMAGSMSAGTLFYTPSLTVIIPKLRAQVSREVKLLGQNRLVAIVEMNTGDFVVLGQLNGIEIVTDAAGSGTAFADLNGHTIAFEGREIDPHLFISSALVTSVTV